MAKVKRRVLTISKPYVAQAYRKKLVDWAKQGEFEIGLVCPLQWADQRFEGEPEPGVRTWRLPISLNGKNHFHFYLGLEDVFRQFRPDIVNVEEEHYSLVTWQCFRLARKYEAKSVFYTWQNIDKNYPPPFSWMERYVLRHASAAIGGNSESLEILKRKGFRGKSYEIVQMGVDLDRFSPVEFSEDYKRNLRLKLGLEKSAFWISFFGRLVAEKGLAVLLDALAELAHTDGFDIRCLIAGSGPQRSALEDQARKLRIGERIHWQAPLKSTEVPAYLQAMDALCLPSLTRANWKEQYGRVLAEAMAAGVVTVGSSSGEIPRVISNAGVITAEGDARALAGGLRKLIADPPYFRELQAKGRQRMEERYSDAVVAEKFLQVFRSL